MDMLLCMTQNDALLTADQAGDRLGVSGETVRRWARDGKVAAIVLPSGLRRFRREDVEALLTPTTSGGDR